jgi:hypothetical protein
MKAPIAPWPRDPKKPYSHLEPLVQALVETSNRTVRPEGFYLDKDGWRCDLEKPIDFALLAARFEIPPTIKLSPQHDSILCQNTWVEIQGPRL